MHLVCEVSSLLAISDIESLLALAFLDIFLVVLFAWADCRHMRCAAKANPAAFLLAAADGTVSENRRLCRPARDLP